MGQVGMSPTWSRVTAGVARGFPFGLARQVPASPRWVDMSKAASSYPLPRPWGSKVGLPLSVCTGSELCTQCPAACARTPSFPTHSPTGGHTPLYQTATRFPTDWGHAHRLASVPRHRASPSPTPASPTPLAPAFPELPPCTRAPAELPQCQARCKESRTG